MGLEDVLKGATNSFGFFLAYINGVAQEVGMEKAIDIFTNVCRHMGSVQGGMVKEQAGIEVADSKTAVSLVKSVITDGLGITVDIIEESPTEVRFKCGRCPVYDGREIVGMDKGLYEDMCRRAPVEFMNALVKQFNPNLSYQLIKFRTAPDDFCVEGITLRD